MSGGGIGAFFLMLIVWPIFLLPTIIAVKKNHKYKLPIILINIFGGFVMGVGWLVSLVWCFIEPTSNNINISSSAGAEIEKLHKLKEDGVLSEDEFQFKKRELLGM